MSQRLPAATPAAVHELNGPSWLRISAVTIAGLAVGAGLLLALALAFAVLGLSGIYEDAHDFVGIPVPIVDAWSLVAAGGRLLAVCWLLAWILRRTVRWRIPSCEPPRPHHDHDARSRYGARVITDGNGYGSVDSATAIAGMHIAPNDQMVLHLRLQPIACTTGQVIFVVQTVTVQYETLGLNRTQRFDMDPPQSVFCDGSIGG